LRLLTIKPANALAGVLTHLVFMNDRILLARTAFGAFAGGFDEVRVALVGLNTRTRTLNQKRAKDYSEGDGQRQKNGAKEHESSRLKVGYATRKEGNALIITELLCWQGLQRIGLACFYNV